MSEPRDKHLLELAKRIVSRLGLTGQDWAVWAVYCELGGTFEP